MDSTRRGMASSGVVWGSVALGCALVLGITGIVRAQGVPPPSTGSAAAKSYYYTGIDTNIHVNEDSTMDVDETQTFYFQGEFHVGERDIPLRGVSAITDISVTDKTTGEPLTYSASSFADTDPAAPGHYTYTDSNGTEQILWYFDIANATHTWEIHYKVHGAIAFDQAYDRLYWNIFSGYNVMVDEATATVTLPEAVPANGVNLTAYRTYPENIQQSYASGTFSFFTENVQPGEAFTVDVTWPKGIVSQRAFFLDELWLYWLDILAAMVALACFLAGLLWWFFSIHKNEKPGNVIAQYEPPEHLPPAMAELVAKERISPKGYSATIVDLAIRGYLKIEEIPHKRSASQAVVAAFSMALPILFVVFISSLLVASADSSAVALGISIALCLGVAIYFGIRILRKTAAWKGYKITSVRELAGQNDLKDYEKNYLKALLALGDGKSVSTDDLMNLRYNRIAGLQFQKAIKDVRKEIETETNVEAHAFSTNLALHDKVVTILASFAVVFFWIAVILSQFSLFPYAVMAISVIALVAFMRLKIRRTAEGKVLHDEWLGFKLYLEVAERYRMQQEMTPDLFEKYLPYAMIFGIEKKWAQAFEHQNIVIGAPVWYVGGAGMTPGGVAAGGGFSASAFSASLSSSFSSAFGSAGGAGGGFGGGAAGGGGGGGGGGAR